MKLKLHWQILLALIFGAAWGWAINKIYGVFDEDQNFALTGAGTAWAAAFEYVGSLFINALKMIIVPLIFTSIVVGIAGLGKVEGFGRLGGKTVLYYVTTSFLAIVAGLAMVNSIQPGLVDGKPNPEIKELVDKKAEEFSKTVKSKEAASGQDTKGFSSVTDIVRRTIPTNIFEAFSDNGRMLALIFVSLLTAFGIIFISETGRKSVLPFFEGINELSLLITRWIMVFAPVGVFALVAHTVSEAGLPIFGLLAKYFLVVLGALGIHLLVTLPLMLKFVAKVSPFEHFKAMRNALITAFSTASSSATLPITMRGVHERAGVSNRVTSFTLPLGATVNMDGTALYECVAVIFATQILGLELSFGEQFMVVSLALLTSIGVAGVPSASLVAILIILNNIPQIPDAAPFVGLLLAVDRPLDMCRTAVNVFSDSCGAVIIGKSEGEDQILAKDPDELDDFD